MKSIIFSIILAAMLVAGCNSHHHSEEGAKVTLNNGERWEANSETTQGVARMQEILSRYEGQEPDAPACRKAATELQEALNNIFKQCTMKGDAHEQLHNFLIPISKLVKQLEAENLNECKDAMHTLRTHLGSYATYFK